MHILITDPTYETDGEGYDEFLAELKSEIFQISDNSEYQDTDIGRGADWPMVLVALGGLFFLGKKIQENLDAWIDLATRFEKLLRNITKKEWGYRVDENGAELIALYLILQYEKGKLRNIEKLSLERIDYDIWEERNSNSLNHHPSGLYVITYKVNHDRLYVFGIKSFGGIAFKYISNLQWHEFTNEFKE